MAIVINGSGTVTGISVGGLPDGIVDDGTLATDAVTAVKIADNAVDLAEMASGTDGQIITYDASGNPTAVGPGTDGQVLTSTGAGSPPAFETAGGGLYASVAVIQDQKAYNVEGGTFTSGAWRTRDLNSEVSDTDGIVSIASNQFTLAAGTYTIHWETLHNKVEESVTRLYNVTDTTSISDGLSCYTGTSFFGQNSSGSGVVTISGSKSFEIQSWCRTTYASQGFGTSIHTSASSSGSNSVYTVVTILKHS
jgi:hypothetical protein